MFDWTDESHARLRVMWEQGYHRNVIAAEIGCSPNAVSGKVHRLGYERKLTIADRKALDGPVAEQEIEPQSPPEIIPDTPPEIVPDVPAEIEPLPTVEPTLPTPVANADIIARALRRAKRPEPVNPVAAYVPHTVERITTSPFAKPVVSLRAKKWTERGPRECAYPVGDQPDRPANLECCANRAEPGKSYCSGHLSMMFPERRAREAASRAAKKEAATASA